MFKFDDSLKKIRQRMAPFMSPSIIKFVELEKRGSLFHKLNRVTMRMTPDSRYEVGVIFHENKLEMGGCEYKVSNVYDERYFAEEKFEQLTTIDEQNGFECSMEFDAKHIDVCSHSMSLAAIDIEMGMSFFALHQHESSSYMSQPVTGGLHVVIKIDGYGNIAIHDKNNLHYNVSSNNLVTGKAKLYLQKIMRQDGFRGALMEGFYDGDVLQITDASYLHNKALFSIPLERRWKYINHILAPFEQKDGCHYVYPKTTSANEWLKTYRNGMTKKGLLVSHASSLPRLQLANSKVKGKAGTLLTESSFNKYMTDKVDNGRVVLSQTDNQNEVLNVRYPSRASMSLINQYRVIGEKVALSDMPILL